MNSTHSTLKTRLKVGIFALIGLVMIGVITVWVNDKPFWYRPCQLVHINVEDATGLKTKSPIRSLGLQIGYLRDVDLSETHVTLGICITAPVEVLPTTRAYIRGEGFLGDKFVELKPVKYIGSKEPPAPATGKDSSWLRLFSMGEAQAGEAEAAAPPANPATIPTGSPSPLAVGPSPRPTPMVRRNARGEREIPVGEEGQDVQHLVNRVDELVNQMSGLTNNLKEAINPEELRKTMLQLNRTLENASKTLAPEGGLNQTAQRSLAKLEDAIEQLRDQLTRVNKGEGSVGMLLNDPSYAEQIREAIKNVNRLLSKVGDTRFVVDVGGMEFPVLNSSRGWIKLHIYPNPTRYYLIGAGVDPIGVITTTQTATTANNATTFVNTVQTNQSGLVFTGMLGKIFFNRLDLAVGVLYNAATGSVNLRLGPTGSEERILLSADLYARGTGYSLQLRPSVTVKPLPTVYLTAGLEQISAPTPALLPWFYGAGLSFDDEDIKILFTLR